MGRVAKLQMLQFSGFKGGLNTNDPPAMLTDEFPALKDMWIGNKGEITLRHGYEKVVTVSFKPMYLTESFHSIDTSGRVYNSSAVLKGTITPITNFQYAIFTNVAINDTEYFTSDAATNVIKIVGSSGTTTSITTIKSCRALIYHKDRLFQIGTAANPDRIWYSDLATPETTAATSWLDVGDTAEAIVAAVVFGDDILLFKKSGIWKLVGKSPESFTLYKIDNSKGTSHSYTVRQLRDKLYFYDSQLQAVWRFNGAEFELISDPIKPLLAGGNPDGVAADAWNDRYDISFPYLAGNDERLVFHANTDSWSQLSGNFIFKRNIRISQTAENGVWQEDVTSRYDYTAATIITANLKTPWIRLAGPGQSAVVKRLEGIFFSDFNGQFQIKMYRNYDDTQYKTRTFILTGAADKKWLWSSVGWGDRLHAVQFEFVTNHYPFEIHDLSIFYTAKMSVRGELL